MSTLKVTNIQATGETASRAVSGVAAVLCHFTTVTTTSINYSVNVSSLTDTGTGDTDVALTNAFSDANHVDSFHVGNGSSGDQSFLQTPTSASVIYCFNYSGANAAFDSSLCLLSAHGDLA